MEHVIKKLSDISESYVPLLTYIDLTFLQTLIEVISATVQSHHQTSQYGGQNQCKHCSSTAQVSSHHALRPGCLDSSQLGRVLALCGAEKRNRIEAIPVRIPRWVMRIKVSLNSLAVTSLYKTLMNASKTRIK